MTKDLGVLHGKVRLGKDPKELRWRQGGTVEINWEVAREKCLYPLSLVPTWVLQKCTENFATGLDARGGT